MGGGRVGKRTRQLLVFVHVAVSVGWMGAGAANVVLAMTAGYASDAVTSLLCYRMIDQIDWFLVIPLAFGALATGVVCSLLTPWGLVDHWWVLVKLVLTVAVIAFSTFGVGAWVEESIAASITDGVSPVAWPLAYGALANIAAFLFMTWVSVAKPWGRTARGRRRRTGRARVARSTPATAS